MNLAQYDAVAKEARDLFIAKNKDYNGGVTLESFFPFGMKSYVQMLHVKTHRLVSLAQSQNTVQFEPVRDTMLDLINYCTFAAVAAKYNFSGE
jgi:hypothetical protein